MEWVNAGIQGILAGGFFALVAAGLSFVFGVMRIVNLAHGTLAVLGAYLALSVMTVTGMPWWIALIVVVPLLAALGWVVQMFVLNAAIERGGLAPIIVTFGIGVIVSSSLQEVYSADSRSLPSEGLAAWSIPIADGVSIGALPLLAALTGVVVIVVLQVFLGRTRHGRAMRATSDDQVTAQLMGIDNRRIYALATAIAFATIAVAGVFLGLRTQFTPVSGNDQLIFAFEAVIIGGLGSLWGTLAGGVILGLAQAFGNQLTGGYGVLIANLVFLVVLAAKPTGLFQKAAQS